MVINSRRHPHINFTSFPFPLFSVSHFCSLKSLLKLNLLHISSCLRLCFLEGIEARTEEPSNQQKSSLVTCDPILLMARLGFYCPVSNCELLWAGRWVSSGAGPFFCLAPTWSYHVEDPWMDLPCGRRDPELQTYDYSLRSLLRALEFGNCFPLVLSHNPWWYVTDLPKTSPKWVSKAKGLCSPNISPHLNAPWSA